jgi:hypothetical protein
MLNLNDEDARCNTAILPMGAWLLPNETVERLLSTLLMG